MPATRSKDKITVNQARAEAAKAAYDAAIAKRDARTAALRALRLSRDIAEAKVSDDGLG